MKSEADKRAEIVQEEADALINTQRDAAQEAQAIAEKAGEDARNRLDDRRDLGDAGSREFRDNMRAEEKRDKRIARGESPARAAVTAISGTISALAKPRATNQPYSKRPKSRASL